jgi:hypothetical protein
LSFGKKLNEKKMNGEEIMDNIKKIKNNDFPLWYWKGFFHRMGGQEFCSKDNLEESLSSRLRRSKGSSRNPQQVMEAVTAASTAEFPTESVQESWRIGFSSTYKSAT